MFRHQGKARNHNHNLKLAAILSTVAGIVNITGVLKLQNLTTNITGHFAYFSEQLVLKNYGKALSNLFYIFFFLLGSFVSSFLMEWSSKRRPNRNHILPLLIEVFLLTIVSSYYLIDISKTSEISIIISCILLFSMGLQNAMVSKVSQSLIRTTHLTGLFTDLGIELSQLFFHKELSRRKRLNKSILLKLSIIISFFTGGIVGGVLYNYLQTGTLLFAVFLLLLALLHDKLIFKYYQLKRKLE